MSVTRWTQLEPTGQQLTRILGAFFVTSTDTSVVSIFSVNSAQEGKRARFPRCVIIALMAARMRRFIYSERIYLGSPSNATKSHRWRVISVCPPVRVDNCGCSPCKVNMLRQDLFIHCFPDKATISCQLWCNNQYLAGAHYLQDFNNSNYAQSSFRLRLALRSGLGSLQQWEQIIITYIYL